MITRLFILVFCFFAAIGCKGKVQLRALSFEVYSTRETRNDVVALVEKFAAREKLFLNTGYKHPAPDETRVSMDYIDESQAIAWMFVSNDGIKNKDHVEIEIYPLPVSENFDNKVCDICKKFEASDEMKKIKEKFKISTIVRNGEWWK